jgi:hypothetical protein
MLLINRNFADTIQLRLSHNDILLEETALQIISVVILKPAFSNFVNTWFMPYP